MAKNLNLNIDFKNIDIKKLLESLKNINLSSVKKYASLFPSIALFLAAILIVIMTLLIGGAVNRKMQESAKMAQEVQSRLSQTPSKEDVTAKEQYIQKLKADADNVAALATNASMRELLCYTPRIFPDPSDKSTQVYAEFGKKFRAEVEQLISRIQAKDAPSDAEIRNKTGISSTAGAGGIMTGPGPGAAQGGSQAAMVDAVCLQRAEEAPVYANPSVFLWYPFWERYTFVSQERSLEECWYSQIAFWIYDDITQTIQSINTGSAKISDSAVKRLLGVRFSGPVFVQASSSPYGTGAMGAMGPEYGMMMGGINPAAAFQDKPMYVKTTSPFMQHKSLTGRVCDDTIEVVHFAVSVVVDSSSALPFIKELCSAKSHTFREGFKADGKQLTASHNQITVLKYDMEPVIKEDSIHALYRYGKNSVVRLNLVCEYLFDRKGYDAIKPAPIKKALGQEQASADAGAAQPQPQPGFPPGPPNM